MSDIKEIRKVFCEKNGGFGDASDSDIMFAWSQMDEETKKEYIEKGKQNAISHRPKRVVSDSAEL